MLHFPTLRFILSILIKIEVIIILANKIKIYRKLHCLTQIEFSKKVRLSRSYIADLEAGRNPGNFNVLEKIIKGTNTQMEDWIDEYGKYKKIKLNLTETSIINLIEKSNLTVKNYKIPKEELSQIIKNLEEDIYLYLSL